MLESCSAPYGIKLDSTLSISQESFIPNGPEGKKERNNTYGSQSWAPLKFLLLTAPNELLSGKMLSVSPFPLINNIEKQRQPSSVPCSEHLIIFKWCLKFHSWPYSSCKWNCREVYWRRGRSSQVSLLNNRMEDLSDLRLKPLLDNSSPPRNRGCVLCSQCRQMEACRSLSSPCSSVFPRWRPSAFNGLTETVTGQIRQRGENRAWVSESCH